MNPPDQPPGASAELVAALTAAVSWSMGGEDASLAGAPEPLDTSFGDDALGFELVDPVAPEWRGPLVARFGSRESVAAEVAAITFLAQANDARLHVPALRTTWTDDPVLSPSAAVVTTRPTGAGMLDLLAVDPGRTNELLGLFGTLQAALHDQKVDPDLEGPVRRVTSAPDELASDGGVESNYARELSWLARHQTRPAEPVLCHGAYQPGLVTGDPALGEPLVVRNWSSTVLAEPEYDVAYTVLAFWSSPFFTATRSERAGMKMIRDMITTVYRKSYEGERAIDHDRVQYWQVFHGVKFSIDPTAPPDLVRALAKHLKRLAS